jgi:hypothetical protein
VFHYIRGCDRSDISYITKKTEEVMKNISRIDYLAGCALTGMLANPETQIECDTMLHNCEEIAVKLSDILTWQDDADSDIFECPRCSQEYDKCPDCGHPYPPAAPDTTGENRNYENRTKNESCTRG